MTAHGSQDPPITFTVEVVGSVLTIGVSGELDLACAELFDGLFDLPTEGIDTLQLDLGALSFCDVTGVNALTGLCLFHRSQGREVRIVDVVPQVRRLIAWSEQAALVTRPGDAA